MYFFYFLPRFAANISNYSLSFADYLLWLFTAIRWQFIQYLLVLSADIRRHFLSLCAAGLCPYLLKFAAICFEYLTLLAAISSNINAVFWFVCRCFLLLSVTIRGYFLFYLLPFAAICIYYLVLSAATGCHYCRCSFLWLFADICRYLLELSAAAILFDCPWTSFQFLSHYYHIWFFFSMSRTVEIIRILCVSVSTSRQTTQISRVFLISRYWCTSLLRKYSNK